VLAVLALAACGGPAEPPSADSALETPASADNQADIEPELVATDPGGAPTTGRFEMGVHYLRLSPTQPTSSNPDQVEVAEVFWYGCPHCYAFDPMLERWREQAQDYIHFVRVPAVWSPELQIHARAFYTAEALGKGDEMHAEFFREIHDRGNRLETEDKLREFFGRFNVDAATFNETFRGFEVQAKLQRADELNRRYRISSVPTIVVNGKYTTDAPSVGSYEELLVLVDELAAAEHEGR
jgi:thiol:disulfide interchange protein DsbA